MLKLLKYELRKNRTAILILLAIAAALECWFLYGLHTQGEDDQLQLVLSTMALVFSGYAAIIYVLVVGVTSYSKELKERSAYLIFMTPNPGLKIMASKYLFTLTVGLIFAAVYGTFAAIDVGLGTGALRDLQTFLREFDALLLELGIHLDQFALAVVVMAAYGLLSILSFFAVAYLAITLSHTFLRDRKWRGLVAVALFFALTWLIGEINSLLPNVLDTLTYQESPAAIKIAEAYDIQTTATGSEVLLGLLPSGCVSLAVILLSLFGCAWMLDKKVSL